MNYSIVSPRAPQAKSRPAQAGKAGRWTFYLLDYGRNFSDWFSRFEDTT